MHFFFVILIEAIQWGGYSANFLCTIIFPFFFLLISKLEHLTFLLDACWKHDEMIINLFQADEHVVNEGLAEHPVERNALRDKSGTVSRVWYIDCITH